VLANLGSERNLTAPIVAHTVYDFVGFLLVARDYRKSPARAFEVVTRPMGEPVEVTSVGERVAESDVEPSAD
jgi:hypothetical protein